MSKLTIVAALVLALTQCFCGTSSPSGFSRRPQLDGRIVGAYEIDITDAPHTVSVKYVYEHHICGGSIINEKWILTAAHCTHDRNATKLKIQAGISIRYSPGNTGALGTGTTIDVVRSVIHPGFNNANLDNDFSLLELAANLTFDSTMQPIGLPEQDQEYPDGTQVIVTGWGTHEHLREISVPLVNQELCNDIYSDEYGGEYDEITDSMICAGYLLDGGRNACTRESGAPMVTDGKILGVASWGMACVRDGYPGVYARVASVSSWIKEVTGI